MVQLQRNSPTEAGPSHYFFAVPVQQGHGQFSHPQPQQADFFMGGDLLAHDLKRGGRTAQRWGHHGSDDAARGNRLTRAR